MGEATTIGVIFVAITGLIKIISHTTKSQAKQLENHRANMEKLSDTLLKNYNELKTLLLKNAIVLDKIHDYHQNKMDELLKTLKGYSTQRGIYISGLTKPKD